MKLSNMASDMMGLFCSCFLVIGLSLTMALAATTGNGLASAGRMFKVGGELGWQQPGVNNSDLYTLWATRNRFRVGDSLSFEYTNDTVIEVDKWGYYHCDARQPIVAFNNGNSVFKLDRPGPFYYISGTLNHCKKGQRLLVEVMGFHHHYSHQYTPPPPHNAPPPPDSYVAPSPQPHPTSSAAVASVNLVGFVSVLFYAAFCFICY